MNKTKDKKDKHIIRVNIGSSERIISNKTKGLFSFDKEGKFYIIKNGVVQDKSFNTLDDLVNYINK